jgi:hypothetical protein
MKKLVKLLILSVVCSSLIFALNFNVYASVEKIIVLNQNHYISYQVIDENVIFNLETINDFTDEMTGKFPKSDFFSIEVDVNQNGVIDRNIDTLYGLISKQIGICTGYLFDETASSPCGEFKSKAFLELSFRGTLREQKPHPVFRFTISKNELNQSGNVAHLVFTCYSAKRGYTSYPAVDKTKTFHSLSNTIKIQL